ncbi:MAG: hypothetical protein J5382_10210 [Bacteroidales bacterium]|nr:hypothetical protein [Bacteroidales bacterium]
MGYNVYSWRERGNGGSEASEFRRAAKMAKEALDTMCELADEMEDRYSERRGDYGRRDDYSERGDYGNRGGYGRRDREDYDGWSERRMRDSRGRYM